MRKSLKVGAFEGLMRLVAVLAVLMWCGVAMAAPALYPLPVQEQAHVGATDAVIVQASDFTVTTTNATQVFTNVITGPCTYEFVGYDLKTPFDTAARTNALSSTLTVTMGTNTLINGFQVARDAWRPYKTFVPTTLYNTVGSDTNAMTTVGCYRDVVTNGATVEVVCTLTMASTGSTTAVADLDTGEARIFLKILR